jgi:hypothetical protein
LFHADMSTSYWWAKKWWFLPPPNRSYSLKIIGGRVSLRLNKFKQTDHL